LNEAAPTAKDQNTISEVSLFCVSKMMSDSSYTITNGVYRQFKEKVTRHDLVCSTTKFNNAVSAEEYHHVI
jgi:hypothetical protein